MPIWTLKMYQAAARKYDIAGEEWVFYLVLSMVSGIALCLALLLVFNQHASEWFNTSKSFEITTQFLFIVVLGGAIAVAYHDVEARRARKRQSADKEHERREVQRGALAEFHRSLVDLHNACKKVRRMLRATSIVAEGCVFQCPRSTFEKLMEALEEVQLNAETLKRQVDAHSSLFGNVKGSLRGHLTSVEGYLREVLRQYEDQYMVRRGIPEDALILLDQTVADFIRRGRTPDSKSQLKFFGPAQEIRKLLILRIEEMTPAG
jgi:hypothetical protein